MSILQEAFLEAKQIKDAARQQAENEIIEKHSTELKKRVEGILNENFSMMVGEADEDEDELGGAPDLGDGDLGGDLGGGLDLGGGGDEQDFEDDVEFVDDSDLSGMDEQIPYSFAGGEKMCPCPEEDEEIEIDFDELMSMADKGDDGDMPQNDRNDIMGDMGADDVEGDEIDLRELEDEEEDDDEAFDKFFKNSDKFFGAGGGKETLSELETDDETFGNDDEEYDEIEKILEELETEIEPVPSGWSPRPESEFQDELVKQKLQDKYGKKDKGKFLGALSGEEPSPKEDRYQSMYEDLMKRLNEHKTKAEKINKKNVLLENNNTKYKQMLKESVESLESILLENAVLKYQNKVLTNNSLNERQKVKYVDSIGDAKTIEDVERIYSLIDSGSPSQNTGKAINEKNNALHEAMLKRPKHVRQISSSVKGTEDTKNKMPEKWQRIINNK